MKAKELLAVLQAHPDTEVFCDGTYVKGIVFIAKGEDEFNEAEGIEIII